MSAEIDILTPSHLKAIMAIEEAVQVSPWTRAIFERCFDMDYPGWVLVHQHEVLGFVWISFSAITRECHILNFGVDPRCQRQGYGEQLMQYVITWAKAQQASMIFLEVRRSNDPAIKLYQKLEFNQIGERKGYYPTADGTEDALVFARDLGVDWDYEP